MFGTLCMTTTFGWSSTPSCRTPLSPPLEQKSKCGGSWSQLLTDCKLPRTREEGVRKASIGLNALRGHVRHQLQQHSWTSMMTALMTVAHPSHNPGSDLVLKWREAMAFPTLLGSSCVCTKNLTLSHPAEVVVPRGRLQNLHERHVHHQGRLSSHFG